LLNAVAAIFIFILMLLISADVVGRYVFSRPLWGTFEVAESLLVFIVFLGFAYTQHEKGNIRVQVVANRLPLRVRPLLDFLAHALGLAIFVLITYEAGRHAINAWRIGEESVGMVRVPLWPSRFAVPVGSFFLFIQFAIDAWSDMKRFFRG
jgi:TRAP-type C4-dicarboxylate transport system permease small subunit